MKIIVTGANSQLAYTIKNYNFKKLKNINFFFYNKDSIDISNFDSLNNKLELIKPDLLINCAAYTDVVNSEKNFHLPNNVNNISLKNLSLLTNKHKVTLLHFSTDYVFDGKKNDQYNEGDITNPISVYGKTKLDGEKNIVNFSNNFIILRISWLFSNYKNNFYKFVINNLKSNQNFYAVNDLFSIPTSSIEITKFIYFILENKINIKNLKDIYHFTNTGPVVSWYQFAKYIKESYLSYHSTNCEILPISSNDFFKNNIRPKYSALNNKKLIYKFKYNIENWQHSINSLLNMEFKS